MPDLRQQLQRCLTGRVCLVGVGAVEQGDDGFGVRLAERLVAEGARWQIRIAGTSPERPVSQIADQGFDHVIFFDAVEFGGAPGEVVFLNSEEMAAQFPQVSTHKISLGMLARMIESQASTRVWLLGVQPASLSSGAQLSPCIRTTLGLIGELMIELRAAMDGNSAPVLSTAINHQRKVGEAVC